MASNAATTPLVVLTPTAGPSQPSNVPATSATATTDLNQSLTATDNALTTGQASEATQSQLPANADATANGDDVAESDDEDDDDDEDDEELDSDDSEYDSDGSSVDPLEKELKRKNRLFKCYPNGKLYWRIRESSYTDKELHHRGEYSMAALYDISSPTELRKYVRERGLKDPYPQGVTIKYFYLRILDRADEEKSFPFLQLPPEMRDIVYKELLTLAACPCRVCARSSCHTAIMRVSKQIHEESKNILYGANTVGCVLGVVTDHEGDVDRYVRIHDQIEEEPHTKLDVFFHGMSAIPDWFHRIQSLRIDINVHGCGASGGAQGFLQGCILNLASFLLDGHCLKKLEVNVINHHHNPEPKFVETVLYPLRRLSGLKCVNLTGNVDETVAKSIATEMQRALTPTFNTVPQLHRLRCEAKAYLALVKTLDPWKSIGGTHVWEQSDDPSLAERVSTLIEETEYLEYIDEYPEDTGEFRDAEAEKNLILKMKDLRKCLDAAVTFEFEQKRKEYHVARLERNNYTQKTKWNIGRKGPDYRKGHVEPEWEGRLLFDEW